MMNSTDFKAIESLIDEIIGLSTRQGNNIKKAIKNYFDTKKTTIKLVNEPATLYSRNVMDVTAEADIAMKKYSKKLKEKTRQLKESGEYCGVGN